MLHELNYNNCSMTVNDMGAELSSFVINGREIIWQGAEDSWRGHSPILFPVVGALKNNEIRVNGEPLHIFKHGFAARMQFELTEKKDDFMVFTLHEDEETYAVYPFKFTLNVRFQILENGFAVSYEVTNNEDAAMPYSIGGHPGIALPLEDGFVFEDYAIEFEQDEEGDIAVCPDGNLIMGTKHYDGLNGKIFTLHHEDFDREDALIFTSLKSRKAKLINSVTGKGVEIDFSDFPVLSFWTMPHRRSDYICLEPWHGMNAFDVETGNFEDKPHAIILNPGESKTTGFSITLC